MEGRSDENGNFEFLGEERRFLYYCQRWWEGRGNSSPTNVMEFEPWLLNVREGWRVEVFDVKCFREVFRDERHGTDKDEIEEKSAERG